MEQQNPEMEVSQTPPTPQPIPTPMPTPNPQTTVIVNQTEKKSNGVGLGGFILALIALFLGWVPILGWILWLVGAILSVVGLFKVPRGFAIAGTIISFIGIILLIVVFAGLAGASAFM